MKTLCEVSIVAEDVSPLDTIRDLKRQEPFVPFQIVLSSGDRYVVADPDALAIGTTQLFFYPPRSAGVQLRINQIVAIEENARPAA